MEAGRALGKWTGRQRHQRDRLSAEQQDRLEGLPGWEWRVRRAWEEWLVLLEAFVVREGHARVPSIHMEDGRALGIWVCGQRSQRDRLPVERRRRLERFPGWAWRLQGEGSTAWEEWLVVLETYVAREGHARVPQGHVEEGRALGRWVSDRRKRRARLSAEQQERLEALPGWAWCVRGDGSPAWEEWFVLLEAFVAREGHARVPATHVEEGCSLGSWVGRQRRNRKRLSTEQQHRLEALPKWAWQVVQSWEEWFVLLGAFATREGHARVPQKHCDDGPALGMWVSNQRQHHDRLSAEQRRRLEALPGWKWAANARRANREGH